MTHNELLKEISERLNWTNKRVEESLDAFVSIVRDNLSEGNIVSIQDFGVFKTDKKLEHIYINPDTSERFLVPPKIEVSFTPSSHIKEEYNKNNNN